MDSSSSGGQPACSEELKARLGMPSHCPPQTTSSGGNGGSGGGAHMAPGTFLHPNFYHTSPPLRWNNRNVACKYRILSFKHLISALREHITNSMTQIYNI